ncbi:hypothetical protein ACO0LM_13445 [Undibacterium sp. Di26W]|uniref:hypothetical protein n=1 Tax=Undibacterium sp. Di26W TaxID=3413035 RepID=UPI003BF3887D
MSNFFDSARFARLWRAHWAESWRDYAWFVGIMAMINLISILISFTTDTERTFSQFHFGSQVQWYVGGLLVSAMVFSGRYFKHMVNPGASLITLMRPASVFEKWLLAFVFIGILFPLAYTVGYMLMNYPAVQLAKASYITPSLCESCSLAQQDFGFYIPFITSEMGKTGADVQRFIKMQIFFMLFLTAGQAVIAGGTVFFKRSPVLRTVLTLFLLAIFMAWIGCFPQLGIFASLNDDVLVPQGLAEYGLSIGLWLGLPVLLWAALFFHLKEREVS